MKNLNVVKNISIVLIIFFIPFLDFLKNNINEIDIILGKSFYLLIIILFCFLIMFSFIIKFLFKKKDLTTITLSVVIFYWILFQHNFLKLSIKPFLYKFSLTISEYDSEISLLLLIGIGIYVFLCLKKNNLLVKKFIFIFFFLNFFTSIFQIISFNQETSITKKNEKNYITYPDISNEKKENIYFFILDAMQPLKEFKKNYKLDNKSFLEFVEKKDFKYIDNTLNIYDNTTHSLSAFFYLDKIFDNKKQLKEKTKILYPTVLRENNKSDLMYNLNNLGYKFKWLGNFFAYCPKFNLRYCLNKNQSSLFDGYLYINFFRQSPLITTIVKLGYIIDFDFDKYIFFELNNGMGRLTNFLKETKSIEKPTFYFIHHMSPHWPYINDKNCSYKRYPGNNNFEGYKSAYLCTLKRIKQTIEFLDEFDPNSTIVFQSDHNWVMSKNKEEKKLIFNLIKINKSCHIKESINFNNVNTLRLIFSCMTGNNPEYLEN